MDFTSWFPISRTLRKVEVESFNHDYLPGSPDSRKAWYFKLRESPQGLRAGMRAHFVNTLVNSGRIIPPSSEFIVAEVYGTYVILQDNSPVLHISTIPRLGSEIYPPRPLTAPANSSYIIY